MQDQNRCLLRLPYTFRSTIFLKSGFLGQTISRAVISNLKQKLLKKTYIGGEIAVSLLIDSPITLCNQTRRLSWELYRCHATQLILLSCNSFKF